MCGGGKPKLPFGLDQWVYALPYGLCLATFSPIGAILSYIAAVGGKRTGHGQYHGRAGYVAPLEEQEQLDFIVKWFFGPDTGGYWRKQFGLAITGMAVTLVCGIAYGIEFDALRGAAIAFSGASKVLAYMLAYFIYDKIGFRKFKATEMGEFFTGVFGWGSLACLVV